MWNHTPQQKIILVWGNHTCGVFFNDMPGWNKVTMSGLVPLVASWDFFKLQKQICRTVGPSLAAFLETLVHHQNVDSLNLFYRYYFGRCLSELADLVPLPYSRGRFTLYSDRLHDFSATIPKCYKDFYVNSFFSLTARL